MEIDDFLALLKKRRSIRRFKPDPIPDGYIEKIIEAARWAMSGANAQPWEFIVVRDENTRKKIVDIYQRNNQAWPVEKTRIKELRFPSMAEGPRNEPPGFKDAPVFIVVCGDPRTFQATLLVTHFLPYDGGMGSIYYKGIANATQNICLAAAALGLGSQWLSWQSNMESALKALLDIPDELTVHTIVPIGYPAYQPAPTYRRELDEITHYEKYDRARARSGDDIYDFLLALRQRTKPAYIIKQD
ncbi:MAG: nitroreductase family protein [Dehalococcoidales bacterium]|nr:nitroreductase family protein [Dehalococcoidales bacterium]